ncbi:MAG TPA: hypothetical protein VHR66_25100 [Gemmataceae bacterium]|jgi:hypothetical protein|nr:hypothetical protein [Gemmataceae bacterium]
MTKPPAESDPRFPSGKWVGFYLDKRMPGRHQMELLLTFAVGRMSGEGRDRVGKFTIEGSYEVTDGKCDFVKRYVKRHAVRYHGFNESKGIWGTWEMNWAGATATGGFHIWPEGMGDPTQPTLAEEADVPVEPFAIPEGVPELVPG